MVAIELGREVRAARVERGLSQSTVGSAVGVSHSTVSRIEHGALKGVGIVMLARLLAAVGLELSARAYPGGSPVRDTAHAALLDRLRRRIASTFMWRTEVPLPRAGDPRAWDACVRGTGFSIGVEAETRPLDGQALERRLALKQRDGGMDHVLLIVSDTRSNRAFLDGAGRGLLTLLPGDPSLVLHALERGVDPEMSAVLRL